MTLFFQALPTELEEAVQLGGYISPDISKLTTSLFQEQSLQTLRERVVAYKKLTDESRRIRRIMSTMNTNRVHSNTLVQSHHSSSYAEQTIVAHSNPETKVNERPLVVKKDGHSYPSNPTNGYVSRWRDGFFGYLGCGSDNHRFTSYSKKNDSDSKHFFWQELLAHVPSTIKRASGHIRPSLLQSNPTSISNVTANNNCILINTANTSRKRRIGIKLHKKTTTKIRKHVGMRFLFILIIYCLILKNNAYWCK